MTAERGPCAVFSDAVTLARHAEELGYHRYWVAEHHATASLGIAAPEIVIGHLASATHRLRIGPGGMLLPNHSPLHLAEQFHTLEALYPGRIDLGIGRSHGADRADAVAALARTGLDQPAFIDSLKQVLALSGSRHQPGTGTPAVPEEVPLPPVFLLGTSVSSARLAASLSVGYAFLAAYQDPAAAIEALRAYRDEFQHQPGLEPHAILTLTVVVGKDDNHAEALAQPWRLALTQHALRRGQRLYGTDALRRRPLTTEEYEMEQRPPLNDRRTEIVGTPGRVAARLSELIDQSGADEILVVTNVPELDERLRSYERLAKAMAGSFVP